MSRSNLKLNGNVHCLADSHIDVCEWLSGFLFLLVYVLWLAKADRGINIAIIHNSFNEGIVVADGNSARSSSTDV